MFLIPESWQEIENERNLKLKEITKKEIEIILNVKWNENASMM